MYALSPFTFIPFGFPFSESHSSYAFVMLNSLIVKASITLISTRASSCPTQFRGPRSKGRHAFLVGYKGSPSGTSQRSGRNSSTRGQWRGLWWTPKWLPHTKQCSVGYWRPSASDKKKSGCPPLGADTAGKRRRASLMTARV